MDLSIQLVGCNFVSNILPGACIRNLDSRTSGDVVPFARRTLPFTCNSVSRRITTATASCEHCVLVIVIEIVELF